MLKCLKKAKRLKKLKSLKKLDLCIFARKHRKLSLFGRKCGPHPLPREWNNAYKPLNNYGAADCPYRSSYVRLSTRTTGSWSFRDQSFAAAPTSMKSCQMTSARDGTPPRPTKTKTLSSWSTKLRRGKTTRLQVSPPYCLSNTFFAVSRYCR